MRSLDPLFLLLSLCISFAAAQVEDLGNAAIVTWWLGCNETTPDNLCQDTGTIFSDDDPLYLDFSTCYSNPNMQKRSINFLGRDASNDPIMYSIIFTDEAKTLNKYIPSNCSVTGACSCDSPPSLSSLRDEILAAKTCTDYPPFYECYVTPFEIKKQACYVPATVRHTLMSGGDEFYCSMAAEVHLISPPTPANTNVADPATSPSGGGGLPELGYAAVMSWWPGCNENTPDDLCDESGQVLDQEEPLYLDFDTCYSNPNMDKRSVNFLGKDNNGDPVMYSIIFTDESETLQKYIPTDCDVTGACSCASPSSLASLRFEILGDKTCSDLLPYYECYVTPFEAKEQSCYVPANVSHALTTGGDEFYCSMAARISLVPPSTDSHTDASKATASSSIDSTSLSGGLSELGHAAIVSWWSGCNETTPDDFCVGTGSSLRDDPLYLDFDTCYSNPNMKQRSVNFLGRSSTGDPLMFSVIFTDEAEMFHKFVPSDCTEAGACSCTQPSDLATLRKEILADKSCNDNIPYFECYVTSFVVEQNSCYVPATISSALLHGGDEFFCSMAAKIELAPPSGSDPSTTGGSTSGPAASPSLAGPSEVTSSIPPATMPPDTNSSQSGQRNGDLGYYAITGWFDTCSINSDDCANEQSVATDPIYLNLYDCYSNPKLLDEHSVTFFLKDDTGLAFSFSFFFSNTTWETYRPRDCNIGVCSCASSDLLSTIRKAIQTTYECVDGTDYSCTRQIFRRPSSECLIVAQSLDSNGGTRCAMTATIRHLPPKATGGAGEADLPNAPFDTTGTGAAAQGKKSGSSSRHSGYTTAFIVFTFLFAIFASSYVAVRHWRRRSDTSTMSGANDPYQYPEVWLKTTSSHEGSSFTHSQDSQFTRTALNSPDDSDGVWVSTKTRIGQINDLRFHEVT